VLRSNGIKSYANEKFEKNKNVKRIFNFI